MNVTVRRIGNSEGVILPKEVLERLNLKAGDQLELVEKAGLVTLQPVDETFESQMASARRFMDKYKVALQKLAE